jgi:hypothetical protein
MTAIRRLSTVTATQIEALCAVLIDCVEGGASVSFIHPLALPRALVFWGRVVDNVAAGARGPSPSPKTTSASSERCSWRGSSAASFPAMRCCREAAFGRRPTSIAS